MKRESKKERQTNTRSDQIRSDHYLARNTAHHSNTSGMRNMYTIRSIAGVLLLLGALSAVSANTEVGVVEMEMDMAMDAVSETEVDVPWCLNDNSGRVNLEWPFGNTSGSTGRRKWLLRASWSAPGVGVGIDEDSAGGPPRVSVYNDGVVVGRRGGDDSSVVDSVDSVDSERCGIVRLGITSISGISAISSTTLSAILGYTILCVAIGSVAAFVAV